MRRKVAKHKEMDSVSSYAMGLLSEAERADFEKHLAIGCEVCLRELKVANRTLGQLHLAGPIAAPPASVRERVLAIPSASCVIRAHEGDWVDIGVGVSAKQLFVSRRDQTRTTLVRMEPGARFSTHRHDGDEQCLVLEGEVTDCGIVLRAGDFIANAAGTTHDSVWSETGCLLLIVNSINDVK
jgi:anti-sigma factor ChrR (cupin superfamily)